MTTASLLQGLAQNTLVAGKTTALRLFAGANKVSSTRRIQVTVLRPDGSRVDREWSIGDGVVIPASTSGPSIAVRLFGESLPWVGTYYVRARLIGATGSVVAEYLRDGVELLATKDLLLAIDRVNADAVNPGTPAEIQAAIDAIERLAAIYPVRDGVSALDGNRNAGLRYVINNNPQGYGCGGDPKVSDCQLCPFFASWLNRPAGLDSINLGIAYRFQDPGEGGGGNGPKYCAGQTLPYAEIILNAPLARGFGQETGHCFGLEPSNDPHFDVTVQKGHSKDRTIEALDAELGFDCQLNRPFPSPTFDVMHQEICDCSDGEVSYNSWDWEYLRTQFLRLSSTGPTGPFIRWESLEGHDLRPDLCAARNADGRVEVFVVGGDGRIYHRWESSPAGSWEEWRSLEGQDIAGPISAVNGADGRLYLFACGSDHRIYFRRQLGPNASWDAWGGVGGEDVRGFAVARNHDGRLEVAAVFGDGTLRTCAQVSPDGAWARWGSLDGRDLKGPVAFAANADGRLEAFVVGSDGVPYHRWQSAPNGVGGWSTWANLSEDGLPKLDDIRALPDASGRLHLILMKVDGAVSLRAQVAPNGGWGPSVDLFGRDLHWPGVVGRTADGRLEVGVIGGDSQYYGRWQVDADRSAVWANWQGLGGRDLQRVTMTNNSRDQLELFAIGGDGKLYRGAPRA